MNEIALYTDSCSDLTNDQAKKLGVKIIPIYYYFSNDTTEYGGQVNISMKEFFDRVKNGYVPTTASSDPYNIYKMFEKDIKEDKAIICVTISSKLSSSYNNCVLAANLIKEKYENAKIHIVDSLSGSMCETLILKDILNQNSSFEDIVSKIEKEKNLYHIEFFVNSLDYLFNGGRLGKTSYNIGKVLNIKPLIGVNDLGEVQLLLKAKGIKKLQNILIERMKENIMQDSTIGIVHSNSLERAESLKETINKLNMTKEILLSEISPTIASHIGPDAFGLAYKLKNN